MSKLYLTFKVFHCKRAQCFPDSQWALHDLWRILTLSGVEGDMPEHMSYEEIVNILLDRLNTQRPVVYALDMGDNLVLNSQTVTIKNHQLNIGLYAVLHRLENTACDHIWSIFYKWTKEQGRLYQVGFTSSERVQEKQAEIIQLQERIQKLEQEKSESNYGRLEQQFKEGSQLLKRLQSELIKERKKDIATETKNFDLVKRVQMLEAQALQYKEKLDMLRTKLGHGWEDVIDEIQVTKEQLRECRNQLNRL